MASQKYRGFTEAQKRANEKYIEGNLEQIAIRVKKGRREMYRRYAESQNKSLAGLIQELIEKDMKEHGIDIETEGA